MLDLKAGPTAAVTAPLSAGKASSGMRAPLSTGKDYGYRVFRLSLLKRKSMVDNNAILFLA